MRKTMNPAVSSAALALGVAGLAPAAPYVIRDYGALKRKLAAGDKRERREAPTMEQLTAQMEKIAGAVEAMRSKNETRMAELEKKGNADPLDNEQIKRMQADIAEMRTVKEAMEDLRKKMGRPNFGAMQDKEVSAEAKEHRTALLGYLRAPNSRDAADRLERAEKAARKAEDASAAEFETRAIATTSDSAGGFAVPEQIASSINAELLETSPLRDLVNVVTVGTKDYKELVNRRGTGYGWVGETDARAETGTPTLGEVAPTFGMLYAYPKATEESLQDMFFDVETWLQGEVVEAFAAGEENAIVLGNGTNKPTGFLAGPTPVTTDDATRAFGTLQYVATGQAATWKAFSAGVTGPLDTFQQIIYQLKKGYRANARWLMNKLTAGELMLFKDAQGNYMWQQSLLEGQPDRLLGYAVSESEEMPDKAANAFPVAFGDFKAGYTLADLAGMRITRDDITTPGYVKWYVRRRLGGKIRKSEAIKLIKIAAA